MTKRIAIIGSGLAGSILANELSQRCDVTVLEIGPEDGFNYPAFTNTNKRLAHIKTFCHGSGGGTNLWHNGLIPIDPDDVSSAPFRNVLKDCRKYMDKAASKLHFAEHSYESEYSSAREAARILGQQIGDFSDGVDSLIYPKTYAPLVLNDAASAFYNVSDIRFKSNQSSVDELIFRFEDKQQHLPVDFVVLCCGSFGTPIVLRRLLESAGRDPRDTGIGLIDHPMGFVGKFRFPESISNAVKDFSLLDGGAHEYRSAVRLKSDCGDYTACAFFRPAITMANDLETYIYKSKLGASTGKKRLRNALSPRILHPDIIAEIVSHLFPIGIPTRTYSVLFMGEQRERRGRVSGSEDLAEVDWSISDRELEVYNSMIHRLTEMLAATAEKSVVNANLDSDWLWSGAHHSGTTMMGESGSGSIDTNLQVNGLDNAFVCDASVIQEHSYANTGLTIGQLACRLADHICEV